MLDIEIIVSGMWIVIGIISLFGFGDKFHMKYLSDLVFTFNIWHCYRRSIITLLVTVLTIHMKNWRNFLMPYSRISSIVPYNI